MDRGLLFTILAGSARSIEDQSVEMGRPGMRVDNYTLRSVEAAGVLLEVDKLIDMNQIAFGAPSKENDY